MDDEERERKTTSATPKNKTDIKDIARYFDKPINDAAKILGATQRHETGYGWGYVPYGIDFIRLLLPCQRPADICPTVLKKICRRHGFKRWPNRRLQSIDKNIQLLRSVLQSDAEGSGPWRIFIH